MVHFNETTCNLTHLLLLLLSGYMKEQTGGEPVQLKGEPVMEETHAVEAGSILWAPRTTINHD